jgi:SecD/SecF fusion protein
MQGKGIIKFFLILLAAVCLMQYLFILPTRGVEKAADAYAAKIAAKAGAEEKATIERQARTAYLDSMSSEVVTKVPLLKEYTYEDLKKQQLALGLDLKGGMSVILQVDLKDFLKGMSNDSKDPIFMKALDSAEKIQEKTPGDFVSIFASEYQKAGGTSLASIFGRNESLKDRINFSSPNSAVTTLLRQRANETVDLTFKRLKDRIDKFGVTQPNVSLDAARDLIVVELPGIDNPERARRFLQASAKLEFWDVYRTSDNGISQAMQAADSKLETILKNPAPVAQNDTSSVQKDTSGNALLASVDTTKNKLKSGKGPLFSIFTANLASGQQQLTAAPSVLGFADKNKKDLVLSYLNRPEIKTLFPADLEFRWSAKPTKDNTTKKYTKTYELYAIKKDKGEKAPLEGDHVTDASANPDSRSGAVAVSLKMDGRGAKIWGDMTTKAAQGGNREIAIVLDDEVVSAPRVQNAILTGDSQITGDFSIQDGKDLANILQIGKLPAKTKIIQESLVGPSLGADNIGKSLKSILIGLLTVMAFMALYYSTGGIVSIIALLANLVFIIGALSNFGTVLTLPGIAGLVLTMGIAVDINVVIYERIREELRMGKTIVHSIQEGFKHSLSAVIDANVTTLLSSMVMAYFGLGPIKGFAVVLIIGILFSMITAILITRFLIDWMVKRGMDVKFWIPATKNALTNIHIDWVGMRKVTYAISCGFILIGIISYFSRGFELGVDFKGGYSYNVSFDKNTKVNIDDLRKNLTTAFEGAVPVVKQVDVANTFNITTSYMIDKGGEGVDEKVVEKLYNGISKIGGSSFTLEQFKSTDFSGTKIISSSKVGATVADDISRSSFKAAFFALLLIFLYILFRFSRWQYSMGAIAALFHDSLFVLGVFSLLHGILPFSLEVDQAFIAALLTIIGYSNNDTVIVFDRMREFLHIHKDKTEKEIINMAINSTLSRTVITSLLTMVVVLILFLFGGSSIRGFAFALVVGIIVGTYSSIFIAAPVVYDLAKSLKSESKAEKKHFSRAVK